MWLSRYHRPRKVIFDNGSEFKRNFIEFIKYFASKPACTAIKNSQANAILERIHEVVSSMLNTKDSANTMSDTVALWIQILAYIAHAVRCSYHRILQTKPVKLVFGCNIILDICF